METMKNTSDIPDEMKEKLASLDTALTQIESVFQPLLRISQSELYEKLNAMEKAKLELAGVYTINSLFWTYLNICGVNPKEHSVKQELDRIRSYMDRAKNIQDAAKAPKIDKAASKRFVKSALWKAAQKKTSEADSSGEATPNSTGAEAPSTSKTSPDDFNVSEPPTKKRRKR
uniref:Nuclear nucleic acid-binding protein C1D n=1 Tax=Crassostrea virginica TaxID=6565 RepID=A0A8B8E0M1_CRAVI|nr:nuclear nucleic acid-binding protein C1D-like [Crassostrea virginica]